MNLVKSHEPKIYSGKVPQEFYNNRGLFDFWRYPLVYPYSIGCIEVNDFGNIYSDKYKTDYDKGGNIKPLTDFFNKFIFDKSYFVATKCKGPFGRDTLPFGRDTLKVTDQFFIFSFATGISKNIKGLKNLKKELKNIKFSGDTTFMTIKKYDQEL